MLTCCYQNSKSKSQSSVYQRTVSCLQVETYFDKQTSHKILRPFGCVNFDLPRVFSFQKLLTKLFQRPLASSSWPLMVKWKQS